MRANPCQSVQIRYNQCKSDPSCAIWCQSNTNFSLRHILSNLPILANPCQSIANPVQIQCQSGANPWFQHKFSNLPILAISCQSVPIRSNPIQSMPIQCQSGAIICSNTNCPICQSLPIHANQVPNRCQPGANFWFRHKLSNLPILTYPCQSCQSGANRGPIRGQSKANFL